MPDVRPYLVPSDRHVSFGRWHATDGSDSTPVPDEIEGWDPATTLELRSQIEVDVAAVRAECRLPDDIPLRVVAGWQSSTSLMRSRAGAVTDLGAGTSTLVATLPGSRVGGTLALRTTLTVGRDWNAPVGVASRAGSVLAEHTLHLALEGRTGLFPIEVIDFATTSLHPKAGWHLTLQPEMEKPFLGACWLSINAKDGELIEAISAKKPNPRQEAVIAEMHHGVAQLMIEAAEMADHAFDLAGNRWPPDSVGDVLARYVSGRPHERLGPVTLEDLTERATMRAGRSRGMGFGRPLR